MIVILYMTSCIIYCNGYFTDIYMYHIIDHSILSNQNHSAKNYIRYIYSYIEISDTFIDNVFKIKGSQSDLIWNNEVK